MTRIVDKELDAELSGRDERTAQEIHDQYWGVCPLCGSDDLRKANELMQQFKSLAKDGITPEAMDIARKGSALRKPHFERACVEAQP